MRTDVTRLYRPEDVFHRFSIYKVSASKASITIFFCYTKALSKQVTRGHNVIADMWAGAANQRPFPQTNTQKAFNTLIFLLLDLHSWMDQRTDKASFRVTCHN